MSFLVMDWSSRHLWEQQCQTIRDAILRDNRRMSYKKLTTDHCGWRALRPTLEAANWLNGLLLTVAVEGSISLDGLDDLDARQAQWSHLTGGRRWKRTPLMRMALVTTTAALLIGGLAHGANVIHFYTDEDDIVADAGRTQDTALFLRSLVAANSPDAAKHLRIGTTTNDDDRMRIEWLASLPDLAAGASVDWLTTLANAGQWPDRRQPTVLPLPSKDKSGPILRWMVAPGGRLRKMIVVVRPSGEGRRKPCLLDLRSDRGE